ncbi:hypothetical protein [Flexibacterium corallicola]|nr:hypothetical protein [Pseudovibrio sp. M1P-2-3]
MIEFLCVMAILAIITIVTHWRKDGGKDTQQRTSQRVKGRRGTHASR